MPKPHLHQAPAWLVWVPASCVVRLVLPAAGWLGAWLALEVVG